MLLTSPKLQGALARYRTAEDLPPALFRSKATVRGTVIKVSDGDTMRIRHRSLLWRPDGWEYGRGKKEKGRRGGKLSEETIAVRICAVDCPETAKFVSQIGAYNI